MILFQAPETTIGGLAGDAVARLLSASADVAIVIDRRGVIRDFAIGPDIGPVDPAPLPNGHAGWIGRRFVETVTVESRSKVEALIAEAQGGAVSRAREINHQAREGGDLPIRYTGVPLEDGRVIAVGRDLRSVQRLQQRLVEAQRTMERDYQRLRHMETRYRLLFHVSGEAVAVVDAQQRRIVEANPALGALVDFSVPELAGRSVLDLVAPGSAEAFEAFIAAATASGRAAPVTVTLRGTGVEGVIHAAAFRQDGGPHLLLRVEAGSSAARVSDTEAGLAARILMDLPDGVVITDGERRIVDVNAAFLDMAQLGSVEQARGTLIDEWIGRPGVDAGVLASNLREHGVVRDFGSVLNGAYGTREEIAVTAVASSMSEERIIGFVLRRAPGRAASVDAEGRDLPRSPGELANLVGRVPLKDLVRESADVIEKLCIEAALKITRDNRASAAQMLGLSRQSLYAKLRRYGLGDLDDEDEG